MQKISRFVIWVCKQFNRDQIEHIVSELLNVLHDPSSELGPKDQFKEDHPHYREFAVDPEPPSSTPQKKRNMRKQSTTR
jgi:hypothetical protein